MDKLLWILIVVLAVFIIGKLFTLQIKLVFKLAINALSGLFVLIIVNFLGGFIGLHLPVNWVSCLVSGIFGIPGVALLFVFQWAGII